MKEDVKMVQMLLEKPAEVDDYRDEDEDGSQQFPADVNSSEVVSFTADMDDDTLAEHVHNNDGGHDAIFIGISHTQRKHYWGKDSWAECHKVAVADIKKASPLSVALSIGNEEIIVIHNRHFCLNFFC